MTEPEVLVIGAGPAGLTAATYLGRFRRRTLVIDAGEPRACWIPLSHNMPGFPSGVSGADILKRMREQAEEFGAVIQAGRVETLTGAGDGFVARIGGRSIPARAVLLATGVVDHHPDLPGVERAVQRSLVRICPICDGYEATDKAVAVIGQDDKGAREAAFLRTYSDRVTLIHIGPPDALTQGDELRRLGVELIAAPLESVVLEQARAGPAPSTWSIPPWACRRTPNWRGGSAPDWPPTAGSKSTCIRPPACPASTPRATWCAASTRSPSPPPRRLWPPPTSTIACAGSTG